MPHSSGVVDGCLVPRNAQISGVFDGNFVADDGYLVPSPQNAGNRALLNGNLARRKHPASPKEYCIWDSELAGFGMRVRPSGGTYWCVRLRHRGKRRQISLGATDETDAVLARARARRLLAEVSLDGLPARSVVRATPTISAFVERHWAEVARYWKASTAKRSLSAWEKELRPVFGDICVADVSKTDVVRWRDACVVSHEARYNRALPVLAALLKYAEQLKLRRKGSNPCRGMPRYKREPVERYLSQLEYRRIALALRAEEVAWPAQVAIIRLLLFTGARVGEINDLQWEWVQPPRLMLPDSKTGAKIVWLNSQARAILEKVPRREGCPFVFPNGRGDKPILIGNWWFAFRRRCALPDVRIHDLRHSFASTAIMDNVPLATIGKLLGHALPETTARYAHLSDDVIGDAAQRISASLASALGLRA